MMNECEGENHSEPSIWTWFSECPIQKERCSALRTRWEKARLTEIGSGNQHVRDSWRGTYMYALFYLGFQTINFVFSHHYLRLLNLI